MAHEDQYEVAGDREWCAPMEVNDDDEVPKRQREVIDHQTPDKRASSV